MSEVTIILLLMVREVDWHITGYERGHYYIIVTHENIKKLNKFT